MISFTNLFYRILCAVASSFLTEKRSILFQKTPFFFSPQGEKKAALPFGAFPPGGVS
jgi:hypothetical protein